MDASVEKVIVAVHGIGDQTRFATLQQALSQFCRYHGSRAAVPLGNFHTEGKSLVLAPEYPPELRRFAFAEVYWADIPRALVQESYSLEDVNPWVKTLVSRVRMRNLASRELDEGDQLMIERVLGEMLQTINVLDRLFFLADKMGVFSFDLKKVLVDYLDDVQIVAEFKAQGQEIGKAFERRMKEIHGEYPNAEIYIVAHSEGTVVSLLGLLGALCGSGEASGWIENVRGYMTIGSPIDKHLILWPELFASASAPCRKPKKPIEWHNYYDFGDPVGFELNTAREKFAKPEWKGIFNFPREHDHGFARYPLPGKAHVDYWTDPDVFGHFIQEVVYKEERILPKPAGKSYAVPPKSKTWSRIVSWGGPYLLALVLLFCAVLVLYKATYASVRPPEEKVVAQAVTSAEAPREKPPKEESLKEEGVAGTFFKVAAITCLLAGLTVLARIPRLTGLWPWRLFGFVFFLASIAANRLFSCLPRADFRFCYFDETIRGASHFSFAGVAIAVVIAAYFTSKLKPEWGTQALLVPGGLAVGYVLYRFFDHNGLELHRIWPLLLAGAAFLYLWWLVALIFDLIFVWHRYIRYSGEGRYLRLPGAAGEKKKTVPLDAPLAAGS